MNLKSKLNSQDLGSGRKRAALGGPHQQSLALYLTGLHLTRSVPGTLEHGIYPSPNFKLQKGNPAWPTLGQAKAPGLISYNQKSGLLMQKSTGDSLLWSVVPLGERKLLRVQPAAPSHPRVQMEMRTCRGAKITKVLIELYLSNEQGIQGELLS